MLELDQLVWLARNGDKDGLDMLNVRMMPSVTHTT